MSDFANGFRPSLNVMAAPGRDPVQRQMMLDGLYEPDEARLARGVPALDGRSKDYLSSRLVREMSYFDPNSDPLGMGRPLPPMPGPDTLLETQGLPPLRPPSFRQQNDDALFGDQIGDLLAGRQVLASPFDDALSQLGGMAPLSRLGSLYGGGR